MPARSRPEVHTRRREVLKGQVPRLRPVEGAEDPHRFGARPLLPGKPVPHDGPLGFHAGDLRRDARLLRHPFLFAEKPVDVVQPRTRQDALHARAAVLRPQEGVEPHLPVVARREVDVPPSEATGCTRRRATRNPPQSVPAARTARFPAGLASPFWIVARSDSCRNGREDAVAWRSLMRYASRTPKVRRRDASSTSQSRFVSRQRPASTGPATPTHARSTEPPLLRKSRRIGSRPACSRLR